MIQRKKISVNLTTTHNRIDLCLLSAFSIINQTIRPDQINIWISSTAYLQDNGINKIPKCLNRLIEIDPIVNIRYTKNIGPYRKTITPLNLIGDDYIVVTADDDILYGSTWLSSLLETHYKNPDKITAARVRAVQKSLLKIGLSSYANWPIIYEEIITSNNFIITTGGGSVIDKDIVNLELLKDNNYLNIAPTADDIWLSQLFKKSNLSIATCPNAAKNLIFLRHEYGLEKINLTNKINNKISSAIAKSIGALGIPTCKNDEIYKKTLSYFNDL